MDHSINIPIDSLFNIGSALSAFLLAIGGFALNKIWQLLQELEVKVDTVDRHLSEYKVHCSEKFEERATVQSGLARVHDRIDEMRRDLQLRMDGIGSSMATQMQEMQKNIIQIISNERGS